MKKKHHFWQRKSSDPRTPPFCNHCIHSQYLFDPDVEPEFYIAMTCDLGRKLHHVLPKSDEPLQTRRWGWQYIGGHCSSYRTIFDSERSHQEPQKNHSRAWWTQSKFQHNPLKGGK